MIEPRGPTMSEMGEILKAETLLKVAHVEDEEAGRFSSCFIGHSHPYNHCDQQLKYEVRKVTTAPKDSQGIYCYPLRKLEYAQEHASGEAGFIIEPPCVVLEVKPLGEFSGRGYPMSVYVVGVYRKEGKYVNPFKVGDRVKVKESVEKPRYGWGDAVTHKDIGVVKEVHEDRLEVNFPTFMEGRYNWSAHALEMELAPEPEEEWVDVTRECTLDFLHAFSCEAGGEYIQLCHGKVAVACFGFDGQWQPSESAVDYKIEQVQERYLGTLGTFRILKRELK